MHPQDYLLISLPDGPVWGLARGAGRQLNLFIAGQPALGILIHLQRRANLRWPRETRRRDPGLGCPGSDCFYWVLQMCDYGRSPAWHPLVSFPRRCYEGRDASECGPGRLGAASGQAATVRCPALLSLPSLLWCGLCAHTGSSAHLRTSLCNSQPCPKKEWATIEMWGHNTACWPNQTGPLYLLRERRGGAR